MARPQSAHASSRRKVVSSGLPSATLRARKSARAKRPKSAPYRRPGENSQSKSGPKLGPTVVQLSGPLQQHWEQQIDLANRNLKRKKAKAARKALEKETAILMGSPGVETDGIESKSKESELNAENNRNILNPLSVSGQARRQRQRPRSALPRRSRSAATLNSSAGRGQLRRQRPQSAIARLQKNKATISRLKASKSAPQLKAPSYIFASKRPSIPAAEVDEMKDEHYAKIRQLKSKLFELERERDEESRKRKEIEKLHENEKADKESLLYNVHLLRKRLQLLTAREIENQRQLRTFTKLQPLFKTLQEKFNFGSAEEVVSRFEAMERGQLEHFQKISDMDENRRDLETKVASISKARNDQVAALNTEIFTGTSKLESDLNDLRRELDQAKAESRRNESFRDKYISLDSMVRELYVDACEKTGLVDMKKFNAKGAGSKEGSGLSYTPEEEAQHPDFNNPEQMVNALRSLYYCTGPTRAGKMLRDLIVYANRMYKNHIKRDGASNFYDKDDRFEVREGETSVEDLRFKPAEILEQISKLIDKKAMMEKDLRSRTRIAIAEKKRAEEEMKRAQRLMRRDQAKR
jgi:hypothetical protein